MAGKFKWVAAFLVVGVLATALRATDFTGSVSSDWADACNWTSGVPDSSTNVNVGTAGNSGVSASLSGSGDAFGVRVGNSGAGSLSVGGTLNLYGDDVADHTTVNPATGADPRLIVGLGGATGNLVISGSVNVSSKVYHTEDEEWHSFNMGGLGPANVTMQSNSVVTTAADIGVGKMGYWHRDGYDTSFYMASGSTLNIDRWDDTNNVNVPGTGWLSLGLGDGASLGATKQIMTMDNATIRGTLFHCGGTLVLKGTNIVEGGNYRARLYADPTDPTCTVIKLVADTPVLFGFGKSMGGRVDVSDCNHAGIGVWFTIFDAGPGTYWPISHQNVDFVPGTDTNVWQMRIVFPLPSGSERKVQVRYVPEPATLMLLGIGGLAAIRRRRK